MPRFYFHTEDGSSKLDPDGLDLDTPRLAQIEAVRLLGELLADQPQQMLESRAMQVIVTDETGLILFVLDISAIEAPALAGRPIRASGDPSALSSSRSA